VPSKRPSSSLSGSSALILPSPSVSSVGLGSSPSMTPSSSLSASFGFVPISVLERVAQAVAVGVDVEAVVAPLPAVGSRLAGVDLAVVVRCPRRRR
jgi:hypothetical protein